MGLVFLTVNPIYFPASSRLSEFESIQNSILSRITNVHLDEHGEAQASLPVKFGGLGVRNAVMLAPAAV